MKIFSAVHPAYRHRYLETTYGRALYVALAVIVFWVVWSAFVGQVPVSELTVGDYAIPVTRWIDIIAGPVAVYLFSRALWYVRDSATVIHTSFLWVVWAAMCGIGALLVPDGNLLFAAGLFVVLFVVATFTIETAMAVHCVGGLCIGAGIARGFVIALVGAGIIILAIALISAMRRWRG